MTKYKIGDKVYVKRIGMVATVKGRKSVDYIIKAENGRMYEASPKELEDFIEPRFNIGDKFQVQSNKDWVTEIVKLSLNKKTREYSYLCFDLKDGYVRGVGETELAEYKQINKKLELCACCKLKF